MKVQELKESITAYIQSLQVQELAPNTLKAYQGDINSFLEFVGAVSDDNITQDTLISYKSYLQESGQATATINRKLISVNKFMSYVGADDLHVKTLKQQLANNLDDCITIQEYERLLKACLHPGAQAQKQGLKPDVQMWAILQTLANTGIRFSELRFFTVESLSSCKGSNSFITVISKGKQRDVPISAELKKLLKTYCKDQGITAGYIFATRNNTPISNEQISRRLKTIAGYCRISKSKVHPHAFRHLFGKVYMQEIGRLDELADILGHSSIQTTRIYSRTNAKDKADNISKMNLIR